MSVFCSTFGWLLTSSCRTAGQVDNVRRFCFAGYQLQVLKLLPLGVPSGRNQNPESNVGFTPVSLTCTSSGSARFHSPEQCLLSLESWFQAVNTFSVGKPTRFKCNSFYFRSAGEVISGIRLEGISLFFFFQQTESLSLLSLPPCQDHFLTAWKLWQERANAKASIGVCLGTGSHRLPVLTQGER